MAEISEILKKARLEKGFSIAELSDRTKIRKVIIENLENGNFEEFQALYLKAFVRNIAKELKILESNSFVEAYQVFVESLVESNVSEIEKKEEEVFEIKQKKSVKPKKVIRIDDEDTKLTSASNYFENTSFNPKNNASKLFKARPKLNTNLLIYSGTILFLIIILLITFWPLSNSYEAEPPKFDSKGNSKTIEIGEDNSDKSLLDFFRQSDSLYLKAEVSDTVWFSMIIDNQKKVQTSLVPQQTYMWTAAKEYRITHGNAGKIKLYLNDKLLEPFAPAGFVAKNVIITADKIINNNSQRVDSVRTQKKTKEKKQEPEFRFIEPSNLDELDNPIKK
jgi:transcriptional regulator with XRE-family HTH domain